MSQRISLLSVWLIVSVSGCARDAPTGVEPRAVDRLADEELTGLTLALVDVRSRILPALGSGAAVQALGGALEQLEPALSRADVGALEGALGRAQGATAQLRAGPDVDVVQLVLERITAVASGSTVEKRREP